MSTLIIRIILLGLVLAGSTLVACDDEQCSEPDPRGLGELGDSCITIRDCVAGLTCIGRDRQDQAYCTDPSELPGGADPGCITHPDEWSEHQENGTNPLGPDDDGCFQVQFVSGCNCDPDAGIGECLPMQPFYRFETWRRCNDCCYRLINFWEDLAICEEVEG